MKATCLNCKRTFDCDRDDATFCTDACRAAWYRNHGATGKHADKIRFKSKSCEFCGNTFWFNEYGDRQGQRIPTYCTDKCRIGAWREKHKAESKRHEHAKADSKSWDAFKEQTKKQYTEAGFGTPPKPKSEDFRDDFKIPRYWTIDTACHFIMGPEWRGYANVEITQHWRTLNKTHHPDTNGGKTYKHLAHINAAYDYLKRIAWKRK